MSRSLMLALTITALAVSQAAAHYPWLTLEQGPDGETRAVFSFEEAPRIGDGIYIAPFQESADYWIRTSEGSEPTPLTFSEVIDDDRRWLSAQVDEPRPRSVEGNCRWGIYFGTLLFYNMKHIDVDSIEQLEALADSDRLDFELIPTVEGEELVIRVEYQGKPMPQLDVDLQSLDGPRRLRTNEDGVIRLTPENPGLLAFLTNYVDSEPSGVEAGERYQAHRHSTTLTINWPIGSAD